MNIIEFRSSSSQPVGEFRRYSSFSPPSPPPPTHTPLFTPSFFESLKCVWSGIEKSRKGMVILKARSIGGLFWK